MVFIRVENIVIPIVLLFYNTPPELRLLNSSFLSSLFHISYVCCVKCESMLYVPKIRHVFYFSVSSNHAARNCLRWCLIYVFFNFRSTMVSKHLELAKIRPGMWEVLFSIKPTGSMPHQPSSLSRMYATPAIPLLLPCVSRINAAPALLPGTSRMYAPPTTSKKSTARRLCWRLH
jgi:hypothetical protein